MGCSMIVMLFEDLPRYQSQYLHEARTSGQASADLVRRESSTLVVDTSGFNDSTWLNDKGAVHIDALHLVERIRPLLGGQYLEDKMTAEDPKILAKPYTCTRDVQKLDSEVMDVDYRSPKGPRR
jgi:hypothetical protein